jgi:hypothetical protein
MSTKTQAPTNITEKPSLNAGRSGLLQRKCDCGKSAGLTGQCSECQQRKLLQGWATDQSEVMEVPPIVYEVLQSPGQPLDPDTRTLMETRFSQAGQTVHQIAPTIAKSDLVIGAADDRYEREADRVAEIVMQSPKVDLPGNSFRGAYNFKQVRIHTGPQAVASARAVNASAYTVGSNIVFGEGHYPPTTTTGQRLLAHELVHAIQQLGTSNGSSAQLQREIGDGILAPTRTIDTTPEVLSVPDKSDVQTTLADFSKATDKAKLVGEAKSKQMVCPALKSMISATLAICRLAGEDSSQCDKACTKVRVHSSPLFSECNLDMPKIDFKEHKTSGKACGTSALLGVGAFALTNAAEVIHHVEPYARCFLSDYEVHRTVEDKTSEQVGGVWRVIATTPKGTDDTPSPGDNPCMQPPDLHSYDSPGFAISLLHALPVGGVKVSSSATRVEVRANFLEWISAAGPALKINTSKVEWNNVLKLRWNGKFWKLEPGSDIALGHVTL